MADVPGWRVRNVHVRGLRHTRESVVRQELHAFRDCNTLREIGTECQKLAAVLKGLGAFDGADVLIDAGSPGGAETVADVIVTVSEKKRLTSASTGVSTSAGENSLDGSFSVHNAFGWAERLDLNMEYGEQKSTLVRLAATRPRFMGTNAQLMAEVNKSATSYLKHSSFIEKLLGGSASLRVGDADSAEGMHEFGCQAGSRNVCNLTPAASWPILQQRGQTLKSALTYTYKRVQLDHPAVPTAGTSLQLSTELAGVLPLPIIGDVRFLKQTLSAAAVFPVPASAGRLALSLSVDGGLLLPFGGKTARARESSICDRFFLGGPGSLWGFRTRGCGPREYRHAPAAAPGRTTGDAPAAADGRGAPPRDNLGGDIMCVGTARLSYALPGKLQELGWRAHAFASCGGLARLGEGGFGVGGGSLAGMLRTCGGVGLAIPTALGRLEVNLTSVGRRRPEDAVVHNGLQVGLSTSV